MTTNVSGFGTVVSIVADQTFPVGFTVTQFDDGADPLDFSAIDIADVAMGLNGDQLDWSRAMPLPMVLTVIPGSDDDLNLQILADNNRVGQGKNSAGDIITATVVYPDGQVVTLSGGKMVSAPFGTGISSSGRKKTKAYAFKFQNKV